MGIDPVSLPGRFTGGLNHRNESLDLIRGLLAWVVVVVHVVWFADFSNHVLTGAGAYAVDGFIVISGFVITGLLLSKREPYLVFLFRRFMRLFPAFAVCIVLVLLLRPWVVGTAPSEWPREQSENQFFWWHLLFHSSLLHGLAPTAWLPASQIAFIPVGWSISLEFQFYLIAPLLLWWLSRSGLVGFALVAGPSLLLLLPQVAAKMDRLWSPIGAALPQRFFFFLVGSTIYLLQSRAGRISATLYQYPPWTVKLGQVSYSTYLVHYPVLACLNVVIPAHWPIAARIASLAVAGVPLILGASFLLYRFVEAPGVAFGKWASRADEGGSSRWRWARLNGRPNF